MEADADKVDVELARQFDETGRVLGQRAELDAERTLDFFRVAAHAQDHARARVVLLHLVQLRLAVERHGADAVLGRVANVRHLLGRVGEDDALRFDTNLEHFGDLHLWVDTDGRNRESGDQSGPFQVTD